MQAMVMINKQYDIPELNKMAQEFAIQSDKMDMMSDMTDDVSVVKPMYSQHAVTQQMCLLADYRRHARR